MIQNHFHSKALVFFLIFSFILLVFTEASPLKAGIETGKESKPVVKVREGRVRVSAAQKERFELLIEVGKKLFQEEMDYEGAINKFKEAEAVAVTREQRADVYFYLSLAYYATLEERGVEEFVKLIRKLIEIDYYRELDRLLCPPRYIELFQEIKKEYGALKIQSRPSGADVYLDERREPVGWTPLTIGYKAGSVKIRVRKGSKEKKDTLNVIAGKEITSPVYVLTGKSKSLLYVLGGAVLVAGVAAAMLLGKGGDKGGSAATGPTTGSIQVNSSPTGAKVYIDGNDTGNTTNTTLTDVSPGSHTVNLVKEGYVDWEESVSVTAGQTATVNATFSKHTITITSPQSSTIWSQGDEVEIKWIYNGSSSSQDNMGINLQENPILKPGNILPNSFQKKRFKPYFPSRDIKSQGNELNEIIALKDKDRILSGSSRSHSYLGKSFSTKGKTANIRQGPNNVVHRGGFNSFNRLSKTIPRVASPQIFVAKSYIRITTLSNVKIELYKGNNLNNTVVSSTDNDGTHKWTVPTSLVNGSNYKVRLSCVGEAGIYYDSNPFKIEKKSITVTEPSSNTIWTKGEEVAIKWDTKGIITRVKIELYKGGSYLRTIKSSTDNDGSHQWMTPKNLVDGSNYKVKVSSVSEPNVMDYSSKFKIEEKSITVTEPTKNTVWTKGQEVSIKWSWKGTIGSVKIVLYKGSKVEKTIKSSTENDGLHEWAVNKSLEDGDNYKIRISWVNNNDIYGESDYFKIKKDAPPVVAITSPSDGDDVSGSVTVRVNVSDDFGVWKVEFYIDDNLARTDSSSPYLWSWDTTSYTDGSHTIRAKAYDTANQTASDQITVFVFKEKVPEAPTDLQATAVSSSQIDLSWKDNSNNESGFIIERKNGTSGSWSQIATVDANVTIYKDTGLTANTTYIYRVCAYNAAGNSGYSNMASAMTDN